VLQDYRVLKDEIVFKAEQGEYNDTDERKDEQIPTYLQLTIGLHPFIAIS
jgi:hypothetical protein